MNLFSVLYTELLWRPLFNGLVWLYAVLPGRDLGLAIVALTLVIRFALAPLLSRAQESQRAMQKLQPQVVKIQQAAKKNKNKEEQGRALMALYAENNVNPFFAFLALAVQLPILIAMFQVFRQGLQAASLAYLYSFIPHPGSVNPVSLGVLDLSAGNLYLGAVAALTQYFQTKLSSPPPPAGPSAAAAGKGDFASILQWQTTYVFPGLILVWSYTLPAALTLYWTVMNVFGIVQELLTRRAKKYGYGDGQK